MIEYSQDKGRGKSKMEKKYYVMDTNRDYVSMKNFCCYTNDIEQYIKNHKLGLVTNIREVTKEQYREMKRKTEVLYKV